MNNIAIYLANQIILGNLQYTDVVTKKPTFKSDIDTYLTSKDRGDLIV